MDMIRYEALKRYAAADSSDPFVMSRALAHSRNRIDDGQGYRAEERKAEKVSFIGVPYTGIEYYNRSRP